VEIYGSSDKRISFRSKTYYGARFVFKEDVIGTVGIEGRIQVDQVDGFVFDIFAQDREVVAVVKCVHFEFISSKV